MKWNIKRTNNRNVEDICLHLGIERMVDWLWTSESNKPICICICGVATSVRSHRMDLPTANMKLYHRLPWLRTFHFNISILLWTYFKMELVLSMFVGTAIFKSPFEKNTSAFLSTISSWLIEACIVNWAGFIFNIFTSNFSESKIRERNTAKTN